MDSVENPFWILLAVLVLNAGAHLIGQRRLRALLRGLDRDTGATLPPKIRFDTPPTDSMRYVRAVLSGEYVRHENLRVRQVGAFLLLSLVVQAAALALFAWLLHAQ